MSKRKLVFGTKIRVFASSENDLQQLNLGKWLERFIDYVHIIQPREVPQAKDYWLCTLLSSQSKNEC
jgi:CRISPR-associated endoribonuclease Cas6/Csy4 subtype I-F